MQEKLLGKKEACKILKTSRKNLDQMIADHKLMVVEVTRPLRDTWYMLSDKEVRALAPKESGKDK